MTDYLDRTPSNYKIAGGRLWGWGYGGAGALADGISGIARSLPNQVVGNFTDWKTVSTGYHSAAIKYDGSLWVWGYNNYGQLGINSLSNVSSPVQTVAVANNWSQVDIGFVHTAAVKTDGTLWTWGSNDDGRLGLGDLVHRSSPSQVGSNTTWRMVAAAKYHTAAVKTNGTLWAWGKNSYGAMGDNTLTHRSSPVQEVTGNTQWKMVACGEYYTTAIRTTGTLWSWGRGINGQLGDNTAVTKSSPVQEAKLGTNWVDVHAKRTHTVALKSDGTLWLWGDNAYGRLGNGKFPDDVSSPIQTIIGGTDWKMARAGLYHTAAIKTDGTLWTWGSGIEGQLGNDDYIDVNAYPNQIDTPNIYWKFVNAGGTNTFGIGEANRDVVAGETLYVNEDTIWLMGQNDSGQLGQLDLVHRSSPIQLTGSFYNWKDVDAGWKFAAGIKTDGTLWTWGHNFRGQLGDNTNGSHRSSPVQESLNVTSWKQVSCGREFAAAIRTNGTLWSWGANGNGQLGNNDTLLNDKSSPVQEVLANTQWKMVDCGGFHTLAIRTNGTLWSWGLNTIGQLGNSAVASKSSPIAVGADTTWKIASGGLAHSVAIKTDGTLWCWGNNTFGQCATNDVNHRSSPVQEVLANTMWKTVATSYLYTVATRMNGTLWAWGSNTRGQLGINDQVHRSSPVQEVSGSTNWKAIDAGAYHTLAIKTDGTLWGWGGNLSGPLGLNDISHRSSPVQEVSGSTEWKTVAAGGYFSAPTKSKIYKRQAGALVTQEYLIDVYPNLSQQFKQAGLWGWGLNSAFLTVLGDGTTIHRSSPVQTIAGGQNWATIDAGYHAAAVKTDGTLWTWGWAIDGSIGDGFNSGRSSPVQVAGTTWKYATTGNKNTIALKTDGTLWAWGNNTFGTVGVGDQVHRSSPTQITGTTWKTIGYNRGFHFAATRTDNTLWVWGLNSNGQIGEGTGVVHRSSPTQVAGTTWKMVAGGKYHTAAVKTDGSLWCWGRNTSGQVGDNSTTHRSSPVQTALAGTNWKVVSCGFYFTGGIKTDGTLWMWGNNSTDGRLGNESSASASTPVQTVSAGTNWKDIKFGWYHSVALKTDGSLWAWGSGSDGQLGQGDITSRSSPVQIGGYNWTVIAGAAEATFGIRDDSEDLI